MGKFRVSFRKATGDRKEYGIIVEANTLGEAEERATSSIGMPHGKAFLNSGDIVKIEQLE